MGVGVGKGVSNSAAAQLHRAFQGADDGILLCLLSESSWIDEDTLLSAAPVSLRSHYNVFARIFPPSLLSALRPLLQKKKKKKTLKLPPPPHTHTPPPACHWDHEELAPSSVYPLTLNTPFWRAGFYLYLAGDWQLTFCTGGNFWEWGQYLWVF